MQSFIMYLLKANVVVSILFLFYLLMLKNDKSFKQNRYYLLLSLILSLSLPLLPELSSPHLEPIQRRITTANPLNNLYSTIDRSETVSNSAYFDYTAATQGPTPLSLKQILAIAYLLVGAFLLARSITKVFKITLLIRNTDKQLIDGIYYCASDSADAFSFFNYLVINKDVFNDADLCQVIAHENVHIKEWHSVDILFAELAHAILWINPLIVYIKRAIKLNHEYIADNEVINSGIDKKNYQLSILHNSLKFNQANQLTNLYSSSKIKLRIKMMNLKKSPNANVYKYAFVLLLVAASYFLINPLSAGALPNGVVVASPDLKKFEGYYTMKGQNGALVLITASGNELVLKQLWDNRQIDFTATGPLTFSTKENAAFTLKFSGDNAGHINQLLAFGKDVWVKSDYHLPTAITLSEQDLKKFDGYYKEDGQQDAFIQISSTNGVLTLKQLWDYKQVEFSASGPMDFFGKISLGFTLKFSGDNTGHISRVLAFGKDVWVRTNDYHPPVAITISAQDLKKFAGKYKFDGQREAYIQITPTENGLVLKQLWDNKEFEFGATNSLNFFNKTAPGFTLQFTRDNSGGITKVLAFGRDVWKKVN